MGIKNRAYKILFPVGEKELNSTESRLLSCVSKLIEYGNQVDILTYKEEIFNKAKEIYGNNNRVNIRLTKSEDRFWTMRQRDSFAKTFIKFTYDMLVPGTDFKFWKQVGFDDFLWNVSLSTYPKITEKYDIVLFPIPSLEESPSTLCDVFYTNVLYYARENKIPVIGLQIHPIYDIAPIFPKILDFIIVKEPYEKDHYVDIGIKKEKIYLLEDMKDNYCIDTIEDPYKNLILNQDISLSKDTLGIVVVNHSKNRTHLYDIFDVISGMNIKRSVFFTFREYSVKELHEKDIFEDLIKPVMESKLKHYYKVDAGGAVKALMLGDIMISTNYILPLAFASRYKRVGIVYNPLQKWLPHVKNVLFTNSKEELRDIIDKEYKRKQTIQNLGDIINRIMES